MATRDAGSDVGRPALDLLTDVATRYYLRGQSQIEIARALDLDPSTVSRYLRRARAQGIVHVEIRPPRRSDVDLGREVAERYGLQRVVVARATGGPAELASVAAEYVDARLRRGLRLGVSWGWTLAEVVRHLRPGSVSGLSIAQLAGGVNDPRPGIQGHELVAELAERFPDSRVHYLHAPAIVGSIAVRRSLAADPMVEAALDAARRSEVALVGVGEMTASATLVRGRHVSTEDWQRLVDGGAVGNVNTRFFDRHGRPTGELEERTVAIEWQDLQAIPMVVAIAAGGAKSVAIRAALETRAIDVLITDEPTAVRVLEEAPATTEAHGATER